MIVGTAGHVDHGKTSLVRALTGINCDRLPEEKRRGITLELGFAHLLLPDGREVGVVDVPGHHQLVKTMAVGAAGVDVVLLVVASDEGPAAQTVEHLRLCELLGVKRGLLVLTKAELADPASPGLQRALDKLVQGSFLEAAPRLPFSARGGLGTAALLQALSQVCAEVPPPPQDGLLYLPVDRAFAVKGHGTVVTGTALAGSLEVGRLLELSCLPGTALRVRGLQRHGRPVGEVGPRERVAVNLAGVEVAQVRRGAALFRPGELLRARSLEVELAEPWVGRRSFRTAWQLHLGSARLGARPSLVDGRFAKLTLEQEVVVWPQQRFALRAGGELLGGRVLAAAGRGRGLGLERTALRTLWAGGLRERLQAALSLCPAPSANGLALRTGLTAAAVELEVLRAPELFGSTATGGVYLRAQLDRRVVRARAKLEAVFAQGGTVRAELLREGATDLLLPELVTELVRAGAARREGEQLVSRRALPGPTEEDDLTVRLRKLLSGSGLAPPAPELLCRHLATSPGLLLPRLTKLKQAGVVCEVAPGLYFDADAVEGLRQRLLAHLAVEGEISTQEFKEMTGQSRKYAIPLLEYFDRVRVTLRVGERRVARP